MSDLARVARILYTGGPWLRRNLMHYRVYTCPFERMIPFVPEGARVLDVGCGAGLFLAYLAYAVPNVRARGFDISSPAIQIALGMKGRIPALGTNASVEFERIPVGSDWPSGPFNVVSIIDVMHHVDPARQRAIFAEAVAALEPGGLFLYKDMAERPAFSALLNRLHDLAVAKDWIHYVPIRRVEQWGRELGLDLIHAEDSWRLWYRHEFRVFRKPLT